jgi:carbon storage regulator
MLVLSRKAQQSIIINDNIKITVVRIDRNQVRIGIEAPHEIPVQREELLLRTDEPESVAPLSHHMVVSR